MSNLIGKSVYLKSSGCRTNQEEISSIRFELYSMGYNIVDNIEDADIAIINTCSVTAHAESKARRQINRYSSDYPNVKLLVTGCFAQQMPNEISKVKNVNWVVGNEFKNNISQILKQNNNGVFHSSLSTINTLSTISLDFDKVNKKEYLKTRFPVKIQEGCDFKCSYCIVPALRGPSRSADKKEVLQNVTNAVKNDFKEIIITGTHIGQYNYVDKQDNGLFRLLQDIIKIDGNFRVRLSSLDPRDLTDEIFDLVATEPKVCDHIHISVQSLSPDILRKMNRPFLKIESFFNKLSKFTKDNDKINIGGDFIVGFPGESDDMFEQTLSGISKLGFSYGHVFRYSPRPGTSAVNFPDTIHESVKTLRSNALRECLLNQKISFVNKQINNKHTILIESSKKYVGLTSNYLRVKIENPNENIKKNTFLDIMIKEYDVKTDKCIGNIFQ